MNAHACINKHVALSWYMNERIFNNNCISTCAQNLPKYNLRFTTANPVYACMQPPPLHRLGLHAACFHPPEVTTTTGLDSATPSLPPPLCRLMNFRRDARSSATGVSGESIGRSAGARSSAAAAALPPRSQLPSGSDDSCPSADAIDSHGT